PRSSSGHGSALPVPAITRFVSGSYTRPSHTGPPPAYLAQSPVQVLAASSCDLSSKGLPGAGGTVWNFQASAPSLRLKAETQARMTYSHCDQPMTSLTHTTH